MLQGLTELDHNATVVSIDGIGAFDLISRGAMLQALWDVSPAALPFVRQFYGNPSRDFWEDDEGVVHEIDQGEGGEQGDPLMPLLFSLGQHAALRAVQRQLQRHYHTGQCFSRVQFAASGTVETRKIPGARWQNTGVESVWSEATWVRHD